MTQADLRELNPSPCFKSMFNSYACSHGCGWKAHFANGSHTQQLPFFSSTRARSARRDAREKPRCRGGRLCQVPGDCGRGLEDLKCPQGPAANFTFESCRPFWTLKPGCCFWMRPVNLILSSAERVLVAISSMRVSGGRIPHGRHRAHLRAGCHRLPPLALPFLRRSSARVKTNPRRFGSMMGRWAKVVNQWTAGVGPFTRVAF